MHPPLVWACKGLKRCKSHVYDMFEKMFTTRTLNIFNHEIEIYGNMAVAVFYWKFDATLKDGTVIQSKGRERPKYITRMMVNGK